MLKRIANALNTVVIKLVQSLKRFPESLVLIAITALLLIDSNHHGLISETMKEDFPKLPMILAMGFVLFLCYRMLKELMSFRQKVITIVIWVVFAAYLIMFYFLVLYKLNSVSIIRYIAIMFAFVMAFLFIPYLRGKKRFEMYIIKTIIGFLVTYLYAGVLFVGIAAMVFTVDQLFTIMINSKIYFDIWIVAAGIFAPAYFLGGLPGIDESIEENDYPKVLKILFLYIIMPILSVYTLILYSYFAKVIITQVWPMGMVSNLVLWYSFVTAAIIFLIKPLTQNNLWAKKFSRVMPVIIIPLLFMCFWAMGIRINSYGITESRYYVVVGALWVLFVMLYWIVKRDTWNVVLPISLAVIAILTIVGPQSAFTVSFRSQSARLEQVLLKNNMIKDGKLVKAPGDILSEDKSEISSKLLYIGNEYGLEKLYYIPEGTNISQLKDILGFEIEYVNIYNRYFTYEATQLGAIDISGYRYFADLRSFVAQSDKLNIGDITIVYNNQAGTVEIIRQDKTVYTKNIKDFISKLPREQSKNFEITPDKLVFTDRQGDIEVKYIFRSLATEEDSNGQITINNADFSIFIK